MRKDFHESFLSMIRLANLLLIGLILYIFFTYLLPLGQNILAYIPLLFLPFIIALLIAVLIEPLIEACEKQFHFSRQTAVLFSLFAVSVIFISILSLVLYLVTQELGELYRNFFIDRNDLVVKFAVLMDGLRNFFHQFDLPQNFLDSLQHTMENNLSGLQQLVIVCLNGMVKMITMLPGLLIFLGIAVIACYFMARDRLMIRNFLLGLVPSRLRLKIRNLIGELFRVLVGVFKAYTLLILITMIGTLIALKMMGNPYALSIALLVGFLDIVPVLGPGLFFLPWILYHFYIGSTATGIVILMVYVFIVGVRQLLEPKIIGDNIGLHPLATIIVLYVGLKLGGIIGMIMAPAILVVFLALYRTGIIHRPHWLK